MREATKGLKWPVALQAKIPSANENLVLTVSEFFGGARRIFVELVDCGRTSPKENVVGAICQLTLSDDLVQRHGETLADDAVSKVWLKVRSSLVEVADYNPDFVVFPELSIPPQLMRKVQSWSEKHRCIVIAGSHYETDHEGLSRAQSPVVFPDRDTEYTHKSIISPFEKSAIFSESVQPGTVRKLFRNTEIGDFSVLICSDFLDQTVLAETVSEELDFIFVVACAPDVQRFHGPMSSAIKNSDKGVFICMSNLVWPGHGAGKSSVFAMLDRTYLDKLRDSELTDLEPEQKLWEAKSNNDYFVGQFDRSTKKPPISKSVNDEPNVQITTTRSVLRPKRAKYGDKGDYKLIAFDLDGTLLRSIEFSWVALWRHCGDNDTIWRKHLREYLNGNLGYQEWCDIAVDFFKSKNLTLGDIKGIAKNHSSLTKNFDEGMEVLKGMGFKAGVISGGIDVFLDEKIPNSAEVFDSIFINQLTFSAKGKLTGVNATSFDFEGKKTALERMCDEHNLDVSQAIFVGDTFNDKDAIAAAGHSIVYANRSKDPATLAANHTIIGDDFLELVEYVKSITRPTFF